MKQARIIIAVIFLLAGAGCLAVLASANAGGSSIVGNFLLSSYSYMAYGIPVFYFWFFAIFFVGKHDLKRILWPMCTIFPFVIFTLAIKVQAWDGISSAAPVVNAIAHVLSKDNAVILLWGLGILSVVVEIFLFIMLYQKGATEDIEEAIESLEETQKLKAKNEKLNLGQVQAMRYAPAPRYVPGGLPPITPYEQEKLQRQAELQRQQADLQRKQANLQRQQELQRKQELQQQRELEKQKVELDKQKKLEAQQAELDKQQAELEKQKELDLKKRQEELEAQKAELQRQKELEKRKQELELEVRRNAEDEKDMEEIPQFHKSSPHNPEEIVFMFHQNNKKLNRADARFIRPSKSASHSSSNIDYRNAGDVLQDVRSPQIDELEDSSDIENVLEPFSEEDIQKISEIDEVDFDEVGDEYLGDIRDAAKAVDKTIPNANDDEYDFKQANDAYEIVEDEEDNDQDIQRDIYIDENIGLASIDHNSYENGEDGEIEGEDMYTFDDIPLDEDMEQELDNTNDKTVVSGYDYDDEWESETRAFLDSDEIILDNDGMSDIQMYEEDDDTELDFSEVAEIEMSNDIEEFDEYDEIDYEHDDITFSQHSHQGLGTLVEDNEISGEVVTPVEEQIIETTTKPKKKRKGAYKVPIVGLLEPPQEQQSFDEGVSEKTATLLEETLQEFNIDAQVIGICRGPVVTMFEILPAPGVRLRRIVELSDNLALRLAAPSIRIVAPIPGKEAVGIEVPNKTREIVSFSELIAEKKFLNKEAVLPVALGKNISNEIRIIDLSRTPHLLIAGATGSGKSVCVNAIITSLLYRCSPEEVKLILIDPKIVELSFYNGIGHLLTPVISDSTKSLQALRWCVEEMERRYRELEALNVREIRSFNKKLKEKGASAKIGMPFIVVVIDEFADLMMICGKEIESLVSRLTAKSRAVGIHLVVATQRPSTDVITGLIKSNIPTRISFMVTSKTDSRIILDMNGAENLLGKGDMLYSSASDPFPERIQGPYLSEDETQKVVDFIKEITGDPEYISDEIFSVGEDDDDLADGESDDPLWDAAVEEVLRVKKASASHLQRRFKIGYNRAARLVENMEYQGIIGPQQGSKPREVYAEVE